MSKQKIETFNGCYYTGIKVTPSDWNSKSATTDKDWRIYYDFYDAANNKIQVVTKGMNAYRDLKTRRIITKTLIEDIVEDLEVRGYNPFEKRYMLEEMQNLAIAHNTGFIEALRISLTLKNDLAKTTYDDLKGTIRGTEEIAKKMAINNTPITNITLKHIKLILSTIGKESANKHNKYRVYLNLLFKELKQLELTSLNICAEIPKMKTTQKLRKTLSLEERKTVNDYLKANNYTFWRFMNIFFHSGCREEELLRIKVKDVDLDKQEFKMLIKKGSSYREVIRPIKLSALPLWKEVIEGANKEAFVFSEGLVPGVKDAPIRRDQITRRWRMWVKQRLGIEADFYALKHLHTDMVTQEFGIQAAANHNQHSITVALKHYAVGHEQRQLEAVKRMGNTFI